jgi:hypothetical protein
MGSVKKFLHKSILPKRENHHSRLFIDLAENIHIHHREYRTVFSLDEYFEYAEIISNSTKDVRNFLEQNNGYKEGVYPTTIMIAGGKERQLKFLKNSPMPNKSKYYDDEFAIELQDEYVTDEIHIHYRDFRIGVDRARFKLLAQGFCEALKELEDFEKCNNYTRESHPDRLIENFNEITHDDKHPISGTELIDIEKIKSYWYLDIEKEWKPDSEAIRIIREKIKNRENLVPILLSKEQNGTNFIIDGHHRFYSYLKEQVSKVPVIILDLTFEETSYLREAEVLLKKFDEKTNRKFNVSNFQKSYIAYSLNRYYADSFNQKLRSQKLWFRIIRKIARIMLGKRYIFKKYFEAHNDHN